MWSVRRLSSSSLLWSYGGSKCISYMPSRFAAFSPGGNVPGPYPSRFQNSAGENVRGPYPSRFQNSAGLNDDGMRRNSNLMDYVRGIIDQENSRFSQNNVEHNADIVHMKLMRNNSFISVTDSKGNTKLVATSGSKKVVGDGKATRYAAEATAEYVGRMAREMGLKSVVVKVEGFTYFRRKRQAIMSFREGFCNSRADRNPIVYIEDTTRRPHNGCRLPKKRRI
ncbi:probable ribosomal protein S11, mitochondrial isoform X2 [Manihot esculenta]|uniref:probable ribosomal protein S11, mitochondrial isoform X2 n=1 Tax=Manihot esculenta TaxID=3983 RepID=UPI001CC3A426|nr:probable ribosomal protein S11, mitochondrial isoform X2 [Manihot esculenta]